MAWTTPKTWVDNVDVLSATNLNTHVRDNLDALSGWATYSPSWTAGGGTPTLGNGTLTGRYLTAGDLCHFTMQLTIGSTSSFAGTVAWTFSTPVATQTLGTIFQWFAYDTSAYVAANGNAPIGGGISTFQCYNIGAAQSIGASIPFTWATGDYVVVRGTYEC